MMLSVCVCARAHACVRTSIGVLVIEDHKEAIFFFRNLSLGNLRVVICDHGFHNKSVFLDPLNCCQFVDLTRQPWGLVK
jgi:hypothetical protein